MNKQESGGDVEPLVEKYTPFSQPMEAEDTRTVAERNIDHLIASLKFSPTKMEPSRTTLPTNLPPKMLLTDMEETEQKEATPQSASSYGRLQVELEGSSCASSSVKSVSRGSNAPPVNTESIEKILPPHAAVSTQKEEPVQRFGDIINYPGKTKRDNNYPRNFQSQRFGHPMVLREREILRGNLKPSEKPSYLQTNQLQKNTPRTPRIGSRPKEINIDRQLRRLADELVNCQERILPACFDYNFLKKQQKQLLLYPTPMPQPEQPCELNFDLTDICTKIYQLNGRAVLQMQHNFHMQGGVKACLTLVADGKDIQNMVDNFTLPKRSEWTLGPSVKDTSTDNLLVDKIPSASEVGAGAMIGGQDPLPEVPEVMSQGGVKKKIPRPAPVEEKSLNEPPTSHLNSSMDFPLFPMDPDADLEEWKKQVTLATFYMHYPMYMEYMKAWKK